MKPYSIRDIEQLSGIKAHTIRIWEKRYGFFHPDRSVGNVRSYSDDDLRLMLNVSFLNKKGLKISAIAAMNAKQIEEKVKMLTLPGLQNKELVNRLVVALIEMNEWSFEDMVQDAICRFGFENTIEEMLFPFMKRIGVLWQLGTINAAQEHFISHLVRRKIIAAIDRCPVLPTSFPAALFFLPPREQHEIGLLYYSYLTAKMNIRTLYLGQDVPEADLNVVYDIWKPGVIATVLTSPLQHYDTIRDYLETLSATYHQATIIVSGLQMHALNQSELPPNVVRIDSPTAFKQMMSLHIQKNLKTDRDEKE